MLLWLLISLIGNFRSYRIAIKPDTAISLDGWHSRQSHFHRGMSVVAVFGFG